MLRCLGCGWGYLSSLSNLVSVLCTYIYIIQYISFTYLSMQGMKLTVSNIKIPLIILCQYFNFIHLYMGQKRDMVSRRVSKTFLIGAKLGQCPK